MLASDTGGLAKADVFVERLSLRDFKGIQRLDLRFEPGLTLLVGRNNAGKSRILRAIHIAVGGAAAERDDLTVGSSEPAAIDVVLAPSPTERSNSDNGSDEIFSDSVSQRLGARVNLVSTDPDRERFAWRTTITATSEGAGARKNSRIMAYANGKWYADENAPSLTRGAYATQNSSPHSAT